MSFVRRKNAVAKQPPISMSAFGKCSFVGQRPEWGALKPLPLAEIFALILQWGGGMRLAGFFISLLLAVTPAAAQDFGEIDNFEGWWAYQDGWATPAQDCRDVDGQHRVAIGRYHYDDEAGAVVFGSGDERQIGFYESSCSLTKPLSAGDQFAAAGECRAEGEESSGIVTFEVIDEHTVRVSVPNMKPDMVLSRCNVDYSAIAWQPPPREIFYGSRAGMTMSVMGASALDTRVAMLYVEHTEKDAMSFCLQYVMTADAECVERTMAENESLETKLAADCEVGTFNTPYGGHYRFQAKDTSPAQFDPEFIILDVENGNQKLDGSSASGYGVALGVFEALCPSRVRSS